MIIDHGKLLYDGGLDEIRDRFGTERTLVVDLAEDAVAAGAPLERAARRSRCGPTGRAAGCASTAPTRPPPT